MQLKLGTKFKFYIGQKVKIREKKEDVIFGDKDKSFVSFLDNIGYPSHEAIIHTRDRSKVYDDICSPAVAQRHQYGLVIIENEKPITYCAWYSEDSISLINDDLKKGMDIIDDYENNKQSEMTFERIK